MDEDTKANDDADVGRWIWTPNISYGPFTFGTHRSQTPYVGPRIELGEVDKYEPSFYESTIGEVDLTFWEDYLIGVQARGSFVLDGNELIDAEFDDVRLLIDEIPTVERDSFEIVADFDTFNSRWFMDLQQRIVAVSVGIDPDEFFDQPRPV